MKETKKAFKSYFGDAKNVADYLSGTKKKTITPILFVYGEGAMDFLNWMNSAFSDSCILTEKEFKAGKGVEKSLHLVKLDATLYDDTIQKSVANRNSKKSVVVAMTAYPDALRYVNDPAFKIYQVGKLNLSAMKAEIPEFLKLI